MIFKKRHGSIINQRATLEFRIPPPLSLLLVETQNGPVIRNFPSETSNNIGHPEGQVLIPPIFLGGEGTMNTQTENNNIYEVIALQILCFFFSKLKNVGDTIIKKCLIRYLTSDKGHRALKEQLLLTCFSQRSRQVRYYTQKHNKNLSIKRLL